MGLWGLLQFSARHKTLRPSWQTLSSDWIANMLLGWSTHQLFQIHNGEKSNKCNQYRNVHKTLYCNQLDHPDLRLNCLLGCWAHHCFKFTMEKSQTSLFTGQHISCLLKCSLYSLPLRHHQSPQCLIANTGIFMLFTLHRHHCPDELHSRWIAEAMSSWGTTDLFPLHQKAFEATRRPKLTPFYLPDYTFNGKSLVAIVQGVFFHWYPP